MIICHCKKVTDSQLKKYKSLKEAIYNTEASTCCGSCAEAVVEFFEEDNMTYEYKCLECDHEWEEEQKITDNPTSVCPVCEKESAQRQISGGTGFQLKGSGWFNKGGY